MALLRLKKINWTDFFCKNGIPYTNCQWKSKKQDKKRAKNHKKRCFYWHFCPHSANGAHRLRNSVNGAHHLRNERKIWSGGLKKTPCFGGFLPVFVLFFACSQTICTWHGYFSKKSDPACFFWPQGPLIQSSAAPQGSPPPTQQINIRNINQLSWAIN